MTNKLKISQLCALFALFISAATTAQAESISVGQLTTFIRAMPASSITNARLTPLVVVPVEPPAAVAVPLPTAPIFAGPVLVPSLPVSVIPPNPSVVSENCNQDDVNAKYYMSGGTNGGVIYPLPGYFSDGSSTLFADQSDVVHPVLGNVVITTTFTTPPTSIRNISACYQYYYQGPG